MSYQQFAYLYDELMQDAPYGEWVKFVKEKQVKYGLEGKKLLDLGCGTGELSIRFAKEGYAVTGVDLSTDMLAVAQAKAGEASVMIPFYEQDMSELEMPDEYDIIGIFCDSINYLQSEEEVVQTFLHVHTHLHKDGIFLFDVHSLYKVNHIFLNYSFGNAEEHLSYIWNSFPGDVPNSVEHELTFFIHDEKTNKYNRFDELHYQITYSIEQYEKWLSQAGFELLEVCADFDSVPEKKSERIFFIARKKPSF